MPRPKDSGLGLHGTWSCAYLVEQGGHLPRGVKAEHVSQRLMK